MKFFYQVQEEPIRIQEEFVIKDWCMEENKDKLGGNGGV